MGEETLVQALRDFKCLLGVDVRENSQDEKLEAILQSVYCRLKVLLGMNTVPGALFYIVTEVSVIRFNRIGSEGMSSHSVEGESISYTDNDFAGFMAEIEAWRDEQQETKRGRVRFI